MSAICPQCGKENRDGAAFCTSCGHALPGGDNAQDPRAADSRNADRSDKTNTERGPRLNWPGMMAAVRSTYEKHKKLCIALAAAVCVVIVICIIAAAGSASVYVDWAKQAAFDESYTTFDEAFSYYLVSPSWRGHRDGDSALVEISGDILSGDIRGTNSKFDATLQMDLTEDGSDWSECSFTRLRVGGSSLSDPAEMNASVRNIIAAYDLDWESLAPYVEAFATHYGSWTEYTWDMAVYSQRADAAEYVLNEIADSIYSGLSSVMGMVDSRTRETAVAQIVDAIDSAYASAAPGTTLNEMLDALRATLGFLLLLFGLGT